MSLLDQIRTLLKNYSSSSVKNGLYGLLVLSFDSHKTEYVRECDKRRRFISGFRGSAGTALITKDEALLWTDGRYFVQAPKELHEGWKLMKMGEKGVPTIAEYLNGLPKDYVIGIDGETIDLNYAKALEVSCANLHIMETNLVDQVWKDRPVPVHSPIRFIPDEISGQPCESKIEIVRKQIKEMKSYGLFVSDLAEINYLLNIRGDDILYNPFIVSYLLITEDTVIFYCHPDSINKKLDPSKDWYIQGTNPHPDVLEELKKRGITYREYDCVYEDLKTLSSYFLCLQNKNAMSAEASAKITELFKITDKINHPKIIVDQNQINVKASLSIGSSFQKHSTSPIEMMKAIKNSTELKCIREGLNYDGASLVRFLYWLKNTIKNEPQSSLDEYTASMKLAEIRKSCPQCLGLSFSTILSSGPNGAMNHYEPKIGASRPLIKGEVILIDSGGHYNGCTADITRTVHFGTPTEEEIHDNTLVLMGHIEVATAKFPIYLNNGVGLDSYARKYLWQECKDFNHGTGHGVGSHLSVHEGPQRISKASTSALKPGMTITNEPGYYIDGKYGIRIENLCIVTDAKEKSSLGWDFCQLETASLCPFDRNLIDKKILEKKHVDWINEYHIRCRNYLHPLLSHDPEAQKYLISETEPL